MAPNERAQKNHDELLPGHVSTLAVTDPELIEVFDNFAFDEVLSHGSLDARTRLMVQLASMIASQSLREYRVMIKPALTIGVTPIQIKEIVYQAVPYVGMAKVFDFLLATNEVLRENGVEFPLPSQSTTTPEDRAEKGLAAQKQIIGDGVVEKLYASAPDDQKHIQRFLSANCFGDHLTRSGIDVPTRELLTFSMLVSLGGCDPQVKGHVAANLHVGNSRAKLIDVLTQLLPFIGYPRTLNGLRAVDEITLPESKKSQGAKMSECRKTVLVVGATGSIGHLVVEEAARQGHVVRALVRTASKASKFPAQVEVISGDVTRPETLTAAVDGIHAIVFTLGSDGAGKVGAETIDYGGVRNVLAAPGSRTARIALMTSIGVTNRTGSYNRSTESHDWKRRAERLVRASGLPYTIVRPGWFDYNKANEHQLVFLQGDTRQAGDSSDGVIARSQIAEVLVQSLSSDHALRKTFELVAITGPAQKNLDDLFAALDPDPENGFDGVRDMPNQPLEAEPQRVKDDLHTWSAKCADCEASKFTRPPPLS